MTLFPASSLRRRLLLWLLVSTAVIGQFCTTFAVWMLAERLHLSGILTTVVYAMAMVFCIGSALAIGWLNRSERVNSDAAIGIFLVASLAWGFCGHQLYLRANHAPPVGWDTFLFGRLESLSMFWAYLAMPVGGIFCVVGIIGNLLDPIRMELETAQ